MDLLTIHLIDAVLARQLRRAERHPPRGTAPLRRRRRPPTDVGPAR